MMNFNLDKFIAEHVIGRSQSLFEEDLRRHHDLLTERIDDKSVLVIGGAGTIGASYVKALLQFRPKRLYVVDINENGLTEVVRDLRSSEGYHIPADFKTYPINFGDAVFTKILAQEGPFDIVANFAAHKHVRSEKDEYAIEAMLENNVMKAKSLLDQLMERPPERFFCVSTDKAANPVNVMGASKKLMEEVILAYSKVLPITTARFANVAFSNGSLLAGFLERLMKRQPLSAPLDVRRYFVSPQESGQICLLACMLGDSGDIFFPKLEEAGMKRFSDIATALLQSLGLTACQHESETAAKQAVPYENGQYPVYYFPSDTSGEKEYEEFFTDSETVELNRFGALGVVKSSAVKDISALESMFLELKATFAQQTLTKESIVRILQRYLPTFQHKETGLNLDQKM